MTYLSDEKKYFEAGKAAAAANQPSTPPTDLGHQAAAWWKAGFNTVVSTAAIDTTITATNQPAQPGQV